PTTAHLSSDDRFFLYFSLPPLIRDLSVRIATLVGWRRIVTPVLMSVAAISTPAARHLQAQQASAQRRPSAQERQTSPQQPGGRRAPGTKELTPVEQRMRAVETG